MNPCHACEAAAIAASVFAAAPGVDRLHRAGDTVPNGCRFASDEEPGTRVQQHHVAMRSPDAGQHLE
jgi:hypothetical protein